MRRYDDPYTGCNFLVEISGVTVGGFSEVSGLTMETEVKEYREGGVNDYIHKLAGPVRYPATLVLKHGITDDDTLWNWYKSVRNRIVVRKSGSVILLDNTRQEVMRYNFYNAYPVKWIGPDLNALRAEVAIETLEIAHSRLERA